MCLNIQFNVTELNFCQRKTSKASNARLARQSASRRQPLHGALMTHPCAARPEKPSSQIDA